jgi:cytochrome P450
MKERNWRSTAAIGAITKPPFTRETALAKIYDVPIDEVERKFRWEGTVFVSKAKQQVIEKAQKLAKRGPLPAEAVGRIYQKLVEEMRDWEAKLDATTP